MKEKDEGKERKKLTPEEKIKFFEERIQIVKDQVKFGGRAAITQQKIVLGSYLWKYSQSDQEINNLAKKIVEKLTPEDKIKLEKFIAILNAGIKKQDPK